MQILDTLSGKKISLAKSKKNAIKLFVCGPTVYDLSHIGHARTYIVFDAFVKYLRSTGHKIFYLQNITDIDDKIIKRAQEKKISPAALAKKFQHEYFKDSKALKIDSINKYAEATKHIKEITEQITTLIKKEFAYKTKNGIYFEVRKFKNYGKLSKKKIQDLRPGYRIEPDPEKKDSLDFALWKFSEEKPNWPSPWGWGKPGWHIEDTAITEKYFGAQYDIHGGADELKFPHHEAEIAQQEASSGKKPLVKIWMHTGVLLVGAEKMSKSLGNFITIRDFLKKHSAETLRFLILSHHYRSPVYYNNDLSLQAEKSLETISEFLEKMEFVKTTNPLRQSFSEASNQRLTTNDKNKTNLKKFQKEFDNALNNDFNTPKAIAVIFNLISEINPKIWTISPKNAKTAEDFIKEKLSTLGIKIKTAEIPHKIELLAKKREQFRVNKQFVQSDRLRNQIKVLGYILEDTPIGPMVRKLNNY